MHIFCLLHPQSCESSFTICNLCISTLWAQPRCLEKSARSSLIFLRSRRFKMCPRLADNQSRPTGADSCCPFSGFCIHFHVSFHLPSATFAYQHFWLNQGFFFPFCSLKGKFLLPLQRIGKSELTAFVVRQPTGVADCPALYLGLAEPQQKIQLMSSKPRQSSETLRRAISSIKVPAGALQKSGGYSLCALVL